MRWNQQGNKSLGYVTTPGIKNIVIWDENLYEIRNHKITVMLIWLREFNTRFNHNLHLLSANLSLVQWGVLFSGSKIYNRLPSNIKLFKDPKRFKSALKTYLIENTFYSVEEYYNLCSWWLYNMLLIV